MDLFGQKPQATKRSLRVVPRAPGDLTPLDPAIAEALRRAGLDPEKFSVAPGDAETAIADAVAGVGPAGAQVAHTFRFLRLADALRARSSSSSTPTWPRTSARPRTAGSSRSRR